MNRDLELLELSRGTINTVINKVYANYSTHVEKDDLMQEAMLESLQFIKDYIANPRTYPLSVALNLYLTRKLSVYCCRQVVYNKSKKVYDEHNYDYTIEDRIILRILTNEMLIGLSERQLRILEMYYEEGLTFDSIGRLLGISGGRARQILSETMRKSRRTCYCRNLTLELKEMLV